MLINLQIYTFTTFALLRSMIFRADQAGSVRLNWLTQRAVYTTKMHCYTLYCGSSLKNTPVFSQIDVVVLPLDALIASLR